MKKWIVGAGAVGIVVVAILGVRGCTSPVDIKYDSPNDVRVRADVAKEISREYANSERLRTAALEFGRQLQIAISFPELARQTYPQFDKAVSCFNALAGPEFYKDGRMIEGLVVNTYERSKAYLKYNANLSGYTYEVPISKTTDCAFDLESMEN